MAKKIKDDKVQASKVPDKKKRTRRVTKKEKVLSPGLKELNTLVMADTQLIYCVTAEEDRLIKDFREHIAYPNGIEILHWSAFTGLIRDVDRGKRLTCDDTGDGVAKSDFPKTANPASALKQVANYEVTEKANGAVFFMKDMHTVFNEPIPRQIRDVINWLSKRTDSQPISIVIVAPELGFSQGSRGGGLPITLEKDMVVVDYDLLEREELEDIVNTAVFEINNAKKENGMTDLIELDENGIQEIARAGQGMTFDEFTRAMATSIIDTGTIDVAAILEHKKQAIKKSDILEVMSVETSMDEVGGLDSLKEYFERYKSSFSDEAKAFGVEPLKGVIMTGIPGTGKSLSAKAVAGLWKLPLLRMDVGKVMGSLVGQSEQRMRDALKHAAACAPCVLWIDEMEKGLSGTQSSGASDGGTTARVFGTLLTWMEECEKDVVVIATANAVDQLPPELIRRFNDVFFVDLPESDEREEIVTIHLKKRGRKPTDFDVEAIVKETDGYTGAEIEKTIKESVATAFANGDKVVETSHVLDAVREMKPISKQMADKIATLRAWADGKARYASSKGLKKRVKTKKIIKSSIDSGLAGVTGAAIKKSAGKKA